jgi:hypothetical protein
VNLFYIGIITRIFDLRNGICATLAIVGKKAAGDTRCPAVLALRQGAITFLLSLVATLAGRPGFCNYGLGSVHRVDEQRLS